MGENTSLISIFQICSIINSDFKTLKDFIPFASCINDNNKYLLNFEWPCIIKIYKNVIKF